MIKNIEEKELLRPRQGYIYDLWDTEHVSPAVKRLMELMQTPEEIEKHRLSRLNHGKRE
jgi:hypothetical protein